MDKYGATLPITADVRVLDNSMLVLAPYGLGQLRPHTHGLVLSIDQENYPGIVGGYVPQVSSACLNAIPDGCDAWDFLAGLYELSGVRTIALHPPMLLRLNGKNITLRDAAWKLAGLDIGISV